MNFALCGTIRSATNFLGHYLNKALSDYTIIQENFDEEFISHTPTAHKIKYDFNYYDLDSREVNEEYLNAQNEYRDYIISMFKSKTNFGQISPQYTSLCGDISEIGKVGILMRHPIDVIISCANRDNHLVNNPTMRDIYLRQICYDFQKIDEAIENKNIPYFKYENYTSSIDELKKIIDFLEIDNVNYEAINLKDKINSKENILNTDGIQQDRFYNEISEVLPDINIYEKVMRNLKPFIEKYYSK